MITIPESDLVVHELCLGSNIFGGNATEAESHLVMDAYKSHGGNFIDTADMYNQWVEGHVGGESETVIGNSGKSRRDGDRNQGFKNGYSPRIVSKEYLRRLRRIP
jgi:aryl-alcohol dehydrogenase-like predicted oxidoreductase